MAEPMELDDFLRYQPVPAIPIIGSGLMYSGSRVLLYGKYKTMKSMLALRLALALSRGESWMGFETIKGGCDVMYLQLEIPNPMLQERIRKMLLNAGPNPTGHKLYIWTQPTMKLDTPEGYQLLSDMLAKYKPKVLIIDPIYKVVSGDLLSTVHIQKLVDWVDLLVDTHQLALMMVHHSRKGAYEEWGSDDMLGSVIFSAWADSILKVERRGSNEIVMHFDVVRHATEELPARIYKVDLTNISFANTGRTI